MSNITDTNEIAVIEAFIQETFEDLVLYWIITSCLTFMLYSIILNIPKEIEYIWFKPWSLPKFLYILTRYAYIFVEGLVLIIDVSSISAPIRTCDIIASIFECAVLLGYIGVQGLLVTRAYALPVYQGNKIIRVALGFGFLGGLVLRLLWAILYNSCTSNQTDDESFLIALLGDIAVMLTDVLVFGVCFYNLWGTWKLNREVHQMNSSLASVFFEQAASRFFFTVTLSSTIIITVMILRNQAVGNDMVVVQNCLSSVLLSEFMLELRQCNAAAITANNMSLSPIRCIPDLMQRTHQTILVEMGDSGTGNDGGEGSLSLDSAAESPQSATPPENERSDGTVNVSV